MALVFVTSGNKTISYSDLPPPSCLPENSETFYRGQHLKVLDRKCVRVNSKSKRVCSSANRIYGSLSTDNVANRTAMLVMNAPAHYDAVRITVLAAANQGNAWKVTVAPSASFTKIGPKDATDQDIVPKIVTFGSTDRHNPKNPNGGVATATATEASGSAATFDLHQDRLVSDIIPLGSLARKDKPNAKPLIYIKVFGTNIPMVTTAETAENSTNGWGQAIGEFYGGYKDGDFSVTNPAFWSQWGVPAVEVEFFLRGKSTRNIGITGDSTDQGWVPATAVPQTGGNINGYMRQFAELLRKSGDPVGFVSLAQAGQRSQMSYNNALGAVLKGELTHLVIRPFSSNDRSTGVGIDVALAALQRTTILIQTCLNKGVTPILLKPFPWGGVDTVQYPAVLAYCADYLASGGLVLDLDPVLVDPSTGKLYEKFLTVDSLGAFVDKTHINSEGHRAAANYINTYCSWMFT